MNAMNVINPYLWNGLWVFDDPAKELDKEPLVEGADTFLDLMTEGFPKEACVVMFSGSQFPSAQLVLHKVGNGVGGGTDYEHRDTDHQMWLCPALFKYFDVAPEKIFLSVKPA